MQPARVRQSNQRAILMVLARSGGASNAEISRETGLAPQTVSAVVAELEQAGLLMRGTARRDGTRGQPATPLYINPEGAYAVGAEIGWQRLELVLTDLAGHVLARERASHDYPDAATIFGALGEMAARITAPLGEAARRRIVGLGLAVPAGLAEPPPCLGMPAAAAALWAQVDIAREAAGATGLGVQLLNDGHAACWAQFVVQPSPRPCSFVFLAIDTFVTSGVIAEGRLWEGDTGAVADLGSMLVNDGAGSPRFLRDVASLCALRRRLEAAGRTLDEALAPAPGAEAAAVLEAWIADAALGLAQAILNSATVVAFESALIEGELPAPLLARLVEAVGRRLAELPSLAAKRPSVQQGRLGRPGAAQGAACLRMYRRHYSRELEHMELD